MATPPAFPSAFLHTAIKAAKAAGAIIRKNFGTALTVSLKKDDSFLTTTDLAAEKEILSIIKKAFPDHHIRSEEAGEVGKQSDYVWLIDPLDGTTNFSMHNAFFCTAIALLRKNEPIIAAVYDPIADELFYAERGGGAFLNKKPIRVSAEKDPRRGVLTFCHGASDEAIARACRAYAALKQNLTHHVRQIGAADLELCYTAAGRTPCCFLLGPPVNAYDVFPGLLIAQEAGAAVSDLRGKPFTHKSNDLLVSAPGVHEEVLKHIQAALK